MDEAKAEVFIDECSKSFELNRGEQVKSTRWEISPFFQFYLEIVFLMWGKYQSLGLTEDVSEVAILFRDSGKVWVQHRPRQLRECHQVVAG